MRQEVEAVYLFVSELLGNFKQGTVKDKIEKGREAYIQNTSHELVDTMTYKDDLHENIWLERLYAELDRYFGCNNNPLFRSVASEHYREESFDWTVPIEIDASASMLQYIGVLLNDERLMDMTNLIGEELSDPWRLECIPNRKQLKVAATPMLYGSAKTAKELWEKNDIPYTQEHIKNYNKELNEGAFGVAYAFKEFIINNCNPEPTMKVKIHEETFVIECNRFKHMGEETHSYQIYDSDAGVIRTIHHTDTKKVPDLEQFRRYFVTLLIHNLDSQVADKVVGKVMDKYEWGIPIHDAFLVSPAAAADARRWYGEEMEKIHKNRKSILEKYFQSIGISGAALSEWKELQSKVVPFEDEFKCSPMALK